MSLLVAFAAAAVLTPVLAALALLLGWVDRREGVEDRKPRRTPVPLVGGAAILGALVVLVLLPGRWPDLLPRHLRAEPGSPWGELAWPALGLAFLLGFVDDVLPHGLRAAVKLLGQLGVGVLVAVSPGAAWADASLVQVLGLGVLAVVSMNAVNTFDHQDGAAGVLGALALAPGAMAAAIAGYLPFNTFIRRRSVTDGTVPVAMLGDSGSHVIGVAIATTPGAPLLLLVPLLDLARVVKGRLDRGQPFWVGDRTHLGHRIARLGFGPVKVAALIAAILLPPIVTQAVSNEPFAIVLGLVASAILFVLAIVATESGAAGPPGGPG